MCLLVVVVLKYVHKFDTSPYKRRSLIPLPHPMCVG